MNLKYLYSYISIGNIFLDNSFLLLENSSFLSLQNSALEASCFLLESSFAEIKNSITFEFL